MKRVLGLMILFVFVNGYGQERPIKVVTEDIPNRLAFYAINENEQDLDVRIKISGTNFRQSRAKPRLIRIPAASKVHLKTIMLMRGKKPSYTYELTVNDSLSRRALKKASEKIKIRPKKQITVYLPENCSTCDSLMVSLNTGKYKFLSHKLKENLDLKNQLQNIFGNATPIDSLKAPILNLGGKLYTKIDTYEGLIEALNKD